MTSKVFIDTNVLVYAVDNRHPEKRRVAHECLDEVRRQNHGVISTQVLQEFYVATTRRLDIEPLAAKQMLHALKFSEVVVVDPGTIKEAVDCSIFDRISFWDALIAVAAEKAHCAELLSEDLNDGQVIRGVRIHNPFKDAETKPPAAVREAAAAYRPGKAKR